MYYTVVIVVVDDDDETFLTALHWEGETPREEEERKKIAQCIQKEVVLLHPQLQKCYQH